MPSLKELRGLAPEYQDLNDQQFLETIHQQYAPDIPFETLAEKLGHKIPTKPNALLAALPNFAETGVRTWQQGNQFLKQAVGLQSPEETAKELAWLERRKGEIAPKEGGATAEGLKAIQEASKEGFGPAASAIISNPQATLRTVGESLATFLPDLLLAPITGWGAGTAAKAIATRVGVKALAPEAVAAATNVGKAIHIGGGSAKTEYGSELLELMKDKGVDISSSESLKKALVDPAFMDDLKSTALKKAIPVGIFDAFSMGLAGRLIDPALGAARVAREAGTKLPLGSLAARGAGELGLQAGLGASGEALGQLNAYGQIKDPAGVLMEAFGEVAGAPGEIYSNYRTVKGGREESAVQAEQARAEQQAAQPAQEPKKSFLSDEDRQRIELNPTPLEQAIKDLSVKYKLDTQQTEAILSSDDEKVRFFTAVVQDDPKALNRIDPKAREEIQGLASQFQELAQAKEPAPTLALPAPSPQETPYGMASPRQLNRLISNTLDPRIVRNDLTDARKKSLGEQLPGNAGPRLPLTNEVENILKSDLPDAKKNELLLALSNNPDIQQNQDAKGNDLFVGTPRGEVITQPQARQEANDSRLDQNRQIDQRSQKVQLAEKKFNEIKGNTVPENSAAAASILADLEASGTLDQLKIPRLQTLVREATGKPLPLKPATDILKAYKGLPGTTSLKVPKDTSARASGPAQWGPSPPPEGVAPEKWDIAREVASNSAPGDAVTPRKLMDAGLTSGEAYKATRALRNQGILSGKETYERTDKPIVTYSNVLSPTNELNFLRNELNGKNYGCL